MTTTATSASTSAPSKHIRPRKRTTTLSATTDAASNPSASDDAVVDNDVVVTEDATRQRIQSWTKMTTTKTLTALPSPVAAADKNKKKSILRQKPKYSSSSTQPREEAQGEDKTEQEEAPETTTTTTITKPIIVQETIVERKHPPPTSSTSLAPTATSTSADATFAVEGYVPKLLLQKQNEALVSASWNEKKSTIAETDTDTAKQIGDEKEEELCLVFDSLADLMQHAGTLPATSAATAVPQEQQQSNPITNDILPGSLVEANLSFQCMDPDVYNELLQQEEEPEPCSNDHNNNRSPPVAEDEELPVGIEENETSLFNNDDDDDEDHDNAILQSLRLTDRDENEYYSDDDEGLLENDDDDIDDHLDDDEDDHDTEERCSTTSASVRQSPHHQQQRPFLALWKALCQWVTPQAVQYLRQSSSHEQQQHQPRLASDDMTSQQRCAGLYAMMQLHIRGALEALHCDASRTRLAQTRLAELLRRLDYSQPAPKFLDTAHVKALTCVLLHMVLLHQEGFDEEHVLAASVPPEPCFALGLSMGEYRNLTRSILSFGIPDDDRGVESNRDGQRNGIHSGE